LILANIKRSKCFSEIRMATCAAIPNESIRDDSNPRRMCFVHSKCEDKAVHDDVERFSSKRKKNNVVLTSCRCREHNDAKAGEGFQSKCGANGLEMTLIVKVRC
jgi:hypothetical protein